MKNPILIIWKNSRTEAVEEVTLHGGRDAAEFYLARASAAERTAQIHEGVRVRRAPDLRHYARGKQNAKNGEKY
jgi:hypothetical protein